MHAQLLSHVWLFVILCPWNSLGKNTGVGCHFLLDVVQLLSHVWLFVTPWTAECQAPLSSTISRSLLGFMSIESVMLSNHLILCHPLLFLVSIFPSISIFSSELALHIRWTKYWRFSFSISPSRASHMAQWYRIHLSMQETWVRSLGQEYPLEKEMANSSSILAWNIPWTEEPGGQGPKESDTTEHSIWSWSWRLLKALSMNSVFFF